MHKCTKAKDRTTLKKPKCFFCGRLTKKDLTCVHKVRYNKYCNSTCKTNYLLAKKRQMILNNRPELLLKSIFANISLREQIMLETIKGLRKEVRKLKISQG